MKARVIAALAFVVVAAAAASAAVGAPSKTAAKTLTVWLQTDANKPEWIAVINAANSKFQQDHPGYNVDVQFQSWGSHLQKFDATLAGGNSPDVIEMGNTEMTKYMAAGAFADLSSVSFDNKSTWLPGLAKAGIYNGKLYGVPYYAGSRVMTYRTDLFKKAGLKVPTSLAQLTAGAAKLAKLNTSKAFSPIYVAGTDWYFAMSFVYDYGGSIAQRVSGKWKGTLNSAKSIQGLTAYKNFFAASSRASKTTDETHPNPYDVYAQGNAAEIEGPGWFSCCVGKKYTGVTAQFVFPSHVAGQVMPGFAGGSNLAVPVTSSNSSLGADWIKDYTSTQSEKALQAIGNIPNSTALTNLKKVNERAATKSWFVPTAKHWVDVENGNILRNMLAQILTGKLTVKQAADSASDNITSVLNQP
jgi:N,N'-diacetylchitobiose transport system substrate-binding protein